MILIEKLKKYQPCHHAKLISMGILLVKKYYHLIKDKYQNKLTYSFLGKAFEKQIKTIEDQDEKQIKQLKIKDKLKQKIYL